MKAKNKIKTDAKNVYNFIAYDGVADIMLFGNGGSSAIANHAEVDWTKNSGFDLDVRSLCSNPSMLTMLANDYGYDYTCSKQLCNKPRNAVLILISSSGNSPNIIKAAEVAKELGIAVIGFTGFDGGRLKELCDLSVHITSKDYEEAEDYHQMVMHQVSRLLRARK